MADGVGPARLPQLISAFTALPWRAVLLVAAASGLLAASVVRPGPLTAPAPPFRPRYALTLFRERGPRLANLGYFGHMWELYAMWTWLPAYPAASTATTGAPLPVGVVAFLAIGVAGVAGCLLGGWLVAEHAGWPVAVALLALGPAAGTVAMLRLDRHMAPATS